MKMDTLTKAAAAGIVASVLALIIKKSNPEHGIALTALAAALILAFAMSYAERVVHFIRETAREGGISGVLYAPVIKCVGAAIIGRFAADVCRDAGHSAPASAIELAASAVSLCAALPLIETLISVIGSFT